MRVPSAESLMPSESSRALFGLPEFWFASKLSDRPEK
jgi:hypothetical protein